MRHLIRILAILIAVFSCGVAVGETRGVDESASAFAARLAPPGAELAHPVIEAKQWREAGAPILAFYEQDFVRRGMENAGAHFIHAVMYAPVGAGAYEPLDIGVYEPEGGDPHIQSVFFSNVKGLPRPALFVLVSWDQVHATANGTYYATYAYALRDELSPAGIRPLEKLSAQLEGGCDCVVEGKRTRAKFKNAAEIRAALARMSVQ